MKRALLLWAACAPLLILALCAFAAWRPALESLLGARAGALLASQLASVAAVLGAGWALSRADRPLGAAACVRALLTALGLAWLAFLVLVPAYQRLWFELALAPLAGLFALLVLLELASRDWPAALARGLRALLFALALGPWLLEGTLRVYSAWRPSPLFVRGGEPAGRILEQNRPAAGTLRFGSPCNSRGHYDDEFTRRSAGETRLAVIGDSFSQGIVPLELHYTRVAERELGFAVDNLGVAGIGLPEYEELLAHEALPLDPSAVVIAFFVGNDFELPAPAPTRDAWLASWLDRRNVLVGLLPRRLAVLSREARTSGAPAARVAGEHEAFDPARTLEERYPWLGDPALEEPTISPQVYLGIERSRAARICRLREDELQRALAILARMRTECGARPCAVLLIPDEFQVEDELWKAVEQDGFERDRPQRLLGERLGALGIPVLDLLPVLRAAAPLPDGRRHLYHVRDSHWNTRGNRVAGEALAEFARTLVARPR